MACKIEQIDWSGLMQSQHCFQWSLNHVFNTSCLSPTLLPKVYLNPRDCTSHCKFSENCLEIRNDTFYLESARATASVDTGVWYYEVLLLTNGVMQIGWGTKKCLFLQEEGCGVGDDPVSISSYLKHKTNFFFRMDLRLIRIVPQFGQHQKLYTLAAKKSQGNVK